MSEVAASAPGKAVLFGEYAVLSGAPAVVLAVDRRARVQLRSSGRSVSRVAVPQLGLDPIEFRIEPDGRVCWQGAHANAGVFARCRSIIEWSAARRSAAGADVDGAGLDLLIDTSELYETGPDGLTKLGLGSSAAMTVALAAAMEAPQALPDRPSAPGRLHRVLLAPYRAGQAGQGSGIDLAAALFGGVQAYQLCADGPGVRSLSLPDELELAFFWTGTAASTSDFLQRFRRWQAAQPRQAEAALAHLSELARAGLTAVERHDFEGIMTCINSYRHGMGRIGDLMGAPVITKALAEIAAVAEQHGLAAKPCGAGGGDLAVVAAAEPDRLGQVQERLQLLGYRLLRLAVARDGLLVRHRPATPS